MKIKAKSINWRKVECDSLVFFVFEETYLTDIKELDSFFKNDLSNFLKLEQFSAKQDSSISYYTQKKINCSEIILVGCGKQKDFSLNKFRIVMAKLLKSVKQKNKKILAVNLEFKLLNQENIQDIAQIAAEGVLLGNYKFDKYQSLAKENPKSVNEIFFLTSANKIQHIANGIEKGEIYASATIFARDLINEQPSITTPSYLAQVAKSLVKKGAITAEIWDEKEMKKKGLNGILAVTQGSDTPAKFIILTYKGIGKNSSKQKITIIGKGLTFDSGGLSLKDSKNMENMKLDMSGAAAVLGIFSAISKLKPKAQITGIIAACENMIGPKAYKPGDIITSLNGKTIEIVNTDAEGRVILSDCLAFAVKDKASMIIDLATLTGACMVALGEDIAGIFSNNQNLVNKLINCGEQAGEKMWQLPLPHEYKELIKSDIADIKNVGKNRYAGAITAALFLAEFVDQVPWVHIDIAGPCYAEKNLALIAKGGAGFGVRTILNFLYTITE